MAKGTEGYFGFTVMEKAPVSHPDGVLCAIAQFKCFNCGAPMGVLVRKSSRDGKQRNYYLVNTDANNTRLSDQEVMKKCGYCGELNITLLNGLRSVETDKLRTSPCPCLAEDVEKAAVLMAYIPTPPAESIPVDSAAAAQYN